MNKLYKPNGVEVEVNDQSLQTALDLGWSKTKPKKAPAKKATKKAE